jgi:hypothetical protein
MSTTQIADRNLASMTLKDIAALCAMPSLAKMSRTKAEEKAKSILATRALFKLEAMLSPEAPAPKIDARATLPKVDAAAKPPKAAKAPAEAKAPKVNKHALLLEALRTGGTREQLMTASQFDNKNLSVAMCNLKRAGYVIGIQEQPNMQAADGSTARFYQLVEDSRTTAH